LIDKEDVRIPGVDSLEFIPEPDGEVTERFVIPENFKARQRQYAGERTPEP
jgi:hypothetical protein